VHSFYVSELDANDPTDEGLYIFALASSRFGYPPVQLFIDLDRHRHRGVLHVPIETYQIDRSERTADR
jgi:hypothetical protein